MAPIPPPFCTLARESPDGLRVKLIHCGTGSRSVGRLMNWVGMAEPAIDMEIALYEPDIAHNTGAILRLGACFGVQVHIIEPAGFDASKRALKRAALDYLAHVKIERHPSFAAFQTWRIGEKRRLILLTTKAKMPYTQFSFESSDILLLGRESAGVPEDVHKVSDARVVIPLAKDMRSLNVTTAAAMVLGEALRQTNAFP